MAQLLDLPSVITMPAPTPRCRAGLRRNLLESLRDWRRLSREREALRRYMLFELKAARHDLDKKASVEANKPFWLP